jgi:hypothetical protein
MKHRNSWKRTAVLIGLVVTAVVARAVGPDVKRYVRLKTM